MKRSIRYIISGSINFLLSEIVGMYRLGGLIFRLEKKGFFILIIGLKLVGIYRLYFTFPVMTLIPNFLANPKFTWLISMQTNLL